MKFEKIKTLKVLELFCLHFLMSMIQSKILLHIDTPDRHVDERTNQRTDGRWVGGGPLADHNPLTFSFLLIPQQISISFLLTGSFQSPASTQFQ